MPALEPSMAADDRRVAGVSASLKFPGSLYPYPFFRSQYDPLVQPALIRHEVPLSSQAQATVSLARKAAADIVAGRDQRLLVVVGPCSIHSTELAIEYASRLVELANSLDGLFIIMRAYL